MRKRKIRKIERLAIAIIAAVVGIVWSVTMLVILFQYWVSGTFLAGQTFARKCGYLALVGALGIGFYLTYDAIQVLKRELKR